MGNIALGYVGYTTFTCGIACISHVSHINMAITTLVSPTPFVGSRRRRVLTLALPAVGEQLLNMLVGLVDVFLVGHLSLQAAAQLGYGSAAALAGVGLGGYVIWIVTTLFMAVGAGATALVARATGANDPATVQRATQQALILGLAMGVVAGIFCWFGAGWSMELFKAAPDVAPLGAQFLQIAAWTMPLSGLLFVGNAVLRGVGNTTTPLLLMLAVNGLNIVLALLLVNGVGGLPVLGVAGSGWAAAAGRGLGGVLVLLVLMRQHSAVRLRSWPRLDWDMLRRILRIGVPTGGEQFVFQAALVLFSRQITGLGTIAYAAHNTVITIESVSFLPGFGFAVAATTLVGQTLGAKDQAEARASTREAVLQAVVFMGVMGLLFISVPHLLMRLLVNDPAVVAAGANSLRIVGLIQPLLAANFVFSGGLRGAGDTRFPLLIKIISPWLVRLPLAFFLIPWLGLTGAWIAVSTDLALQGVLSWWRFRGNAWERIDV